MPNRKLNLYLLRKLSVRDLFLNMQMLIQIRTYLNKSSSEKILFYIYALPMDIEQGNPYVTKYRIYDNIINISNEMAERCFEISANEKKGRRRSNDTLQY